MKKIVLLFAVILTFSTSLISCRDTEKDEVEIESVDDNAFEDEDVNFDDNDDLNEDGDIEDAVEEGVNEAAENTGLGGTDDI